MSSHLGAKFSKSGAIKLLAIVHREFLWDAEAAHNVLPKKLLQGSGCDVSEGLCFDPLREILHRYSCVLVIPRGRGKGAKNVDAPSGEWPHRRYGLDFVQGNLL